jgi:hypothetical protein
MILTSITRSALHLLLALVVAAALATAASAAGRPPQMSEQAYAALMARSQALNDRYGNAATGMTPEAFMALYLRSQELNRLYQLGDYATATTGTGTANVPVGTTAPNGFDWADAGIGAGVALGSALLAAAALIGTRGHVHLHLPAVHGR